MDKLMWSVDGEGDGDAGRSGVEGTGVAGGRKKLSTEALIGLIESGGLPSASRRSNVQNLSSMASSRLSGVGDFQFTALDAAAVPPPPLPASARGAGARSAGGDAGAPVAGTGASGAGASGAAADSAVASGSVATGPSGVLAPAALGPVRSALDGPLMEPRLPPTSKPDKSARGLSAQTPAARIVSATGSTLPAGEAEFLAQLRPHRNFYFVSRKTDVELHFRVDYHVDGNDIIRRGSPESPIHAHFSGPSVSELRKAPLMAHGPCCQAVEPAPFAHDEDLETEKGSLSPAQLDEAKSAMRDTLATAEAGKVMIHSIEYQGAYRTVVVTEFIIRTADSADVRSDLRREIKRDLSAGRAGGGGGGSAPSALSELDMLDLDCMLSILDKPVSTSAPLSFMSGPPGHGLSGAAACPPAGSPASSSEVCAGPFERVVTVANASLIFSRSGKLLNREFWRSHVSGSVSSLGDLRPRNGSLWLDLRPRFVGTLALTSASPDPRFLTELAAAAFNTGEPSYTNPISRILFLQGDGDTPDDYSEVRPVRLELRLRSCTSLPDDVDDAERAPPVDTATVGIDIQEAYCRPPEYARHSFTDFGVTATLECEVKALGSGYSTATLSANGREDSCRVSVEARVLESGLVIGDGLALLGRRLEVPVRIPWAAVPNQSVYERFAIPDSSGMVPAIVVTVGSGGVY